MHEAGLILTLAAGLAAALVCGYATHRIGLSPIVGYLAAGLLVGPYTPGYVADTSLATQLAEVGVILLMFGVGLQFHIEELLAVRRIAIPGAILQSAVATALGAAVVHALGWSWAGAIVFGLCLSVASTVVLVRVLSDARALHTANLAGARQEHAHVTFGLGQRALDHAQGRELGRCFARGALRGARQRRQPGPGVHDLDGKHAATGGDYLNVGLNVGGDLGRRAARGAGRRAA